MSSLVNVSYGIFLQKEVATIPPAPHQGRVHTAGNFGAGLKVFLEDFFGAKVALVIADNVKPRLRGQIFGEAEYAAGI